MEGRAGSRSHSLTGSSCAILSGIFSGVRLSPIVTVNISNSSGYRRWYPFLLLDLLSTSTKNSPNKSASERINISIVYQRCKLICKQKDGIMPYMIPQIIVSLFHIYKMKIFWHTWIYFYMCELIEIYRSKIEIYNWSSSNPNQSFRTCCSRGDSIMDLHATGHGTRLKGYGTVFTEFLTDCHHKNIMKLTIRCLYGRLEKDFKVMSDPRH